MNSKTFIIAILIITVILSSYLEIKSFESKKINKFTSDTIIIDTNVLEFYNRVIHEYFDDNSYSAMNLLNGMVVTETNSHKDIQMRDSAGMRVNFYLRSGDIALRIPGFETKFGFYIAYNNISESEFDTLSKITNLGPTLEPSDFIRSSTSEYTNPVYIRVPLTQNTVYSFYLKGKHNAAITIYPVYGLLRLRSAYIQGNEFKLAVDIKINTAGQNQFRRNIVSVKQLETNTPDRFILYQNYPNPFNSITNIRFDIPRSSQVKLIIYDALGREVAVLVNEKLSAGNYEVDWPAPMGDGSGYPSGVYFYSFKTETFNETKRMVLIK